MNDKVKIDQNGSERKNARKKNKMPPDLAYMCSYSHRYESYLVDLKRKNWAYEGNKTPGRSKAERQMVRDLISGKPPDYTHENSEVGHDQKSG